jgi:hypothetical protein
MDENSENWAIEISYDATAERILLHSNYGKFIQLLFAENDTTCKMYWLLQPYC